MERLKTTSLKKNMNCEASEDRGKRQDALMPQTLSAI